MHINSESEETDAYSIAFTQKLMTLMRIQLSFAQSLL